MSGLSRRIRAAWPALAIAVVAPAPVAADTLPKLGATTTIIAGSPSWMDVHVPRPLPIFKADQFVRAKFSLTGAGEANTLYLRGLDLAEDRRRAELQVIHLGRPGEDAHMIVGSNTVGESLPAGRYRMYLASNRPSQARLTLPWLDGEVALEPTRPESYDGGYLPALTPLIPGTSVFGRSGTLTGAGNFYLFAYADRAGDAIDRLESCVYVPEQRPGADAYQPSCPGGMSGGGQPFITSQGTGLIHLGLGDFPPGEYGLGGNLQSAGSPADLFSVGSWISFDDSTPPTGVAGGTGPAALPPLPPAGGPQPAEPPRATPGIAMLVRSRLRVRKGRASVPLRCSASGPCSGSVSLGGRAAQYTLGPGADGQVRLRLDRTTARRVRRKGSAKRRMTLVIRLKDQIQQLQLPVTLSRAPRR
jgi:hypothetical protein